MTNLSDLPATIPKFEIYHALWKRGELSFKFHDTQKIIDQRVQASQAKEILVLSSRQLGKSWWALGFAIRWCIKNPGQIARFLAPKINQIGDIIADNLEPFRQDAPPGLIVRQKSDGRWKIGESSLRIGALERAHVDNNRGGNAGLIICEEGAFVDSDDYVYARTQVIGPQLLHSNGLLIDVTSVNKDIPDHFIHTELKAQTMLSNSFFSYTIYDNPRLTEEQIERAMRSAGGSGSAAWKSEYLNEIVRDGQSVIVPHYDPKKHVKELTLPSSFFLQTVIDWGGVQDKTVALLYTYDFRRNKRQWIDERVFEANTSTDVIVKSVLEMEAGEPVRRIADCHGQTKVDLYANHGFEVGMPIKDDWQAGINQMQLTFTNDENEIHPRCKFLQASLEGGRYNKHRTDFSRSKALGHCDALAAMMYGIRGQNKSNPYPHIYPNRDITFDRGIVRDPMQQVAEAIQPQQFGNDFGGGFKVKQFGAFNKK